MKILKLNEKQEKKLLNLCKKFFPEYIHFYVSEDSFKEENTLISGLSQKTFDINKSFGTEYPNDKYEFRLEDVYVEEYDFHIHWYQLCITELPKRIFDRLNLDNVKIFYKIGFFRERITQHWDITREYFEIFEQNEENGIPNKANHPVDFLWNFVKECEKKKYFKNNETQKESKKA